MLLSYGQEGKRLITVTDMNNSKNPTSDPAGNGKEQAPTGTARLNVEEKEPVPVFTGVAPENDINHKYLATGMVTSMSKMSFRGLWL